MKFDCIFSCSSALRFAFIAASLSIQIISEYFNYLTSTTPLDLFSTRTPSITFLKNPFSPNKPPSSLHFVIVPFVCRQKRKEKLPRKSKIENNTSRLLLTACGSLFFLQQLQSNFASRSKNYHHNRKRNFSWRNDSTDSEKNSRANFVKMHRRGNAVLRASARSILFLFFCNSVGADATLIVQDLRGDMCALILSCFGERPKNS